MFKKVLIANRGEVALRVIRACRELGVATVAVYSEADETSLHVRMADQSVCIGPAASNRSYLNVPGIISAAEVTGCDAIHPGYGFLAENAQFAEICESCEMVFIGPPPGAMQLMGDKLAARRTMIDAGVPVVPGTEVRIDHPEAALATAQEIGFPVIVKAAAGGGGRGMRMVTAPEDLADLVGTAQAEAQAAFGSDHVYLEKYVEEARHVEIQVLADAHGSVIHLGERDCSTQRRFQKLVEESPSPALTAELREAMGSAAVSAARAVGYRNAGTVEFLLDATGRFYFMEMNTRVQVEHPVTEAVTGIDIVKEQIKLACDEPLDHHQEDVLLEGSAIEFRINAEDPDREFMPCAGKVTLFIPPGGPGVRVDTHVYSGYYVPPYYDSLLAKLIVWGEDREEAMARGRRALREFVVEGVHTTIPFHLRVLDNPRFRSGEVFTNFVATHMQSG